MPLPAIPDPLVQVALPTGATVGITDSGGDGPVVVFSHGLLMNHTMFSPQVAALRDDYRVVTWDQRGHGAAEHEGTWTYWDSADDLIAILDHLGVGTAVLAGMSQGGYLSLRAALRYPDRVRALVLMDTQALPEHDDLLPLYRELARSWLADGADPATLEYVATVILGPGADSHAWKAQWSSMNPARAPQVVHPLVEREDLSGRVPRDRRAGTGRPRRGGRRDLPRSRAGDGGCAAERGTRGGRAGGGPRGEPDPPGAGQRRDPAVPGVAQRVVRISWLGCALSWKIRLRPAAATGSCVGASDDENHSRSRWPGARV